jgi:hypothetical protein
MSGRGKWIIVVCTLAMIFSGSYLKPAFPQTLPPASEELRSISDWYIGAEDTVFRERSQSGFGAL